MTESVHCVPVELVQIIKRVDHLVIENKNNRYDIEKNEAKHSFQLTVLITSEVLVKS